MREYEIVWTESAIQDLEEIADYIARDSPGNARRVLARIRERVHALRTLPDRGRIVPELLDIGIKSWRELVLRPHRMVYRVAGNKVTSRWCLIAVGTVKPCYCDAW